MRIVLVLVFERGQIADQRNQTLGASGGAHIGDVLAVDHEGRNAVDAVALHERIGLLQSAFSTANE